MKIIDKKYKWTKWEKFPDPREGEYLNAPFGYGVYQLKNIKTNKYILFGRGKNLAYRMSSLLSKTLGQGIRKNESKREYVLEHLQNIQSRTVSFTNEKEMKECENELKALRIHKFNI